MPQSPDVDPLHATETPRDLARLAELGLIYDVKVAPNGVVNVRMTLTSACPSAHELPIEAEAKVRGQQHDVRGSQAPPRPPVTGERLLQMLFATAPDARPRGPLGRDEEEEGLLDVLAEGHP